jgi:hypothetical protein
VRAFAIFSLSKMPYTFWVWAFCSPSSTLLRCFSFRWLELAENSPNTPSTTEELYEVPHYATTITKPAGLLHLQY